LPWAGKFPLPCRGFWWWKKGVPSSPVAFQPVENGPEVPAGRPIDISTPFTGKIAIGGRDASRGRDRTDLLRARRGDVPLMGRQRINFWSPFRNSNAKKFRLGMISAGFSCTKPLVLMKKRSDSKAHVWKRGDKGKKPGKRGPATAAWPTNWEIPREDDGSRAIICVDEDGTRALRHIESRVGAGARSGSGDRARHHFGFRLPPPPPPPISPAGFRHARVEVKCRADAPNSERGW